MSTQQPSSAVVAADATQSTAPKGTVLKAVIDSTDVEYYASQQETINLRISDGVKRSEKVAVDAVKEMAVAIRGRLNDVEPTLHARDERMREYVAAYIWPTIPMASTESLVAENHLKLPTAELDRTTKTEVDQVMSAGNQAVAALESAVPLRKTLMTLEADIATATKLVFGDEAVAKQCLVPLHEHAFADVLNYIHMELGHTDGQITLLTNELDRISRLKQDAATMEDIPTLETASFSELELLEKIITSQLKRIEIVMPAGEDVKQYRLNAAVLVEKTTAAIQRHRALVKQRADDIEHDMNKVAEAAQVAYDRDVAAQKAFDTQIQRISGELAQNSKRRKEVWKAIDVLLAEAETLAEGHEKLALERSNTVAGHLKRRAEFDSYTRGIDALTEKLTTQRRMVEVSNEFVDKETNLMNTLNKLMEGRGLEAEARELRTAEGRRHLNYYTDFQERTTDLLHRKETRAFALSRTIRTLKLQIAEAVTTLDPHKSKYQSDCEAAEIDHSKTAEQVSSLKEREQHQKEQWGPTELLLEAEGIDFDPPELKTSALRCSKKEQSLQEARKFVTKEQEVVDKDSLTLRKLKMGAQLAKDAHSQRRDVEGSSPQRTITTPPTKSAVAPAAAAASPSAAR